MIRREDVLEQLAQAFPPSPAGVQASALRPEMFVGLASHGEFAAGEACEPWAAENAARSVELVRVALARVRRPDVDEPDEVDRELIYTSQHLDLLPLRPRWVVYPLCLEAFVRFGSWGIEEFSLYRGALDFLTEKMLTPQQQSALLTIFMYDLQRDAYGFDCDVARVLLWAFFMDDVAVIEPATAQSLITGYSRRLGEVTRQPDLSAVADLGPDALKEWVNFGRVCSLGGNSTLWSLLRALTPERVARRVRDIVARARVSA